MKTLIIGLSLASVVLLFGGCKKENRDRIKGKHTPVTNIEKAPLIIVTPTVTGFCGTTWPCAPAYAPSLSKKNEIILNVNATTHASFPSLTFTFYQYVSTSGTTDTYAPITGAQYTCNAVTSYFASNDLDNNEKILIFVNDASGTAPSMSTNLLYNTSTPGITNYPVLSAPSNYFLITMGNFKGQSCQSGD